MFNFLSILVKCHNFFGIFCQFLMSFFLFFFLFWHLQFVSTIKGRCAMFTTQKDLCYNYYKSNLDLRGKKKKGDFDSQDSPSKTNYWCKVRFTLLFKKDGVYLHQWGREHVLWLFWWGLNLLAIFIPYIVVTFYVCL